jgi:hypothetical protein
MAMSDGQKEEEFGRYYNQKIDRAEELEKWVGERVTYYNSQFYYNSQSLQFNFLQNPELRFKNIPPTPTKEKETFGGELGVLVVFPDGKKVPHLIIEDDRIDWYSKTDTIAKEVFLMKRRNFNPEAPEFFDFLTSIPFTEDSREELYKLTPSKQNTLENGLYKTSRFVHWYQKALEDYRDVAKIHSKIFATYLNGLEKTATEMIQTTA